MSPLALGAGTTCQARLRAACVRPASLSGAARLHRPHLPGARPPSSSRVLDGRRRAPPGAVKAASAGSSSGGKPAAKQAGEARQQAGSQPPAAALQQQGQDGQQRGQGKQQYLYEPQYGLPVVRKQLGYSELLRAVRLGEVKEVHFFTLDEEATEMEGPCLVVMSDGTVARSHIPDHDWRLQYALETHGVTAVRMAPTPSRAQLFPPPPLMSAEAEAAVIKWVPYVLVGLVYAATTYVAHLKGDAEDRAKLRKKTAEEARARRREYQEENTAVETAKIMARAGSSVDDIVKELKRIGGTPMERSAVEEIVEKESAGAPGGVFYNTNAAAQLEAGDAWKAEKEAELAEDDPQAQAEQMLRMKTAKTKKARDPEKARKQRDVQRKLRNIKLIVSDKDEDVFFDDVAGVGDAKTELMEVVDFFRKPVLFRASGARVPRGVLLCGPPGTGKTLLARAVAGEAGATFIALNASEFVEMFVGVGASRVRDLFSQARAQAPAIVFIDELDSVGRTRGGAKGNDERDQTLNQLLSEMDGFDNDAQVVVMAATNRRDILDSALIRPGRFDRIVYVPSPDYNGRQEIMQVHLDRRPHSKDLNLATLAFQTHGSSGAQLANLVNTAATVAAQHGRVEIQQADMEKALEMEQLGRERAPFSAEARRRIALMEAATCLLITLLPALEPVLSVTIVPREKHPLGQTVVLPNAGRYLVGVYTRRYLEEQLLTLLAGRAAEEIVYGQEEMSAMQTARLADARRVVTKLVVASGMTENAAIGPRTLSSPARVGDKLMQGIGKYFTPALHTEADAEMTRLLAKGHADAREVLLRNREALDRLTEALLERNSMSGDEVRAVVEQYADKGDLAWRAAEKAVFI